MPIQPNDILTIVFAGRGEDPSLASLIKVANNVLRSLRHIDATMAGTHAPTLNWRISEMSKQSPAQMTIYARPKRESRGRFSKNVARVFRRGLRELDAHGERPKWFDDEVLSRAKDIVAELNNGLERVVFSAAGEDEVVPTQRVAANVDVIHRTVERSHREWTTLVGRLEGLLIHGSRIFYLFTPLSDKPVKCFFQSDQCKQVIDALLHRVSVYGRAKYNRLGEPVSIEVSEFRKIPDRSKLPQFDDLKGIDITAGVDSVEHVRRVRDGE